MWGNGGEVQLVEGSGVHIATEEGPGNEDGRAKEREEGGARGRHGFGGKWASTDMDFSIPDELILRGR